MGGCPQAPVVPAFDHGSTRQAIPGRGTHGAAGMLTMAATIKLMEETMILVVRLLVAGALLAAVSAAVSAQSVDPKIVGFKLPDQIEWKTNPAGTNRSAVLQGDPSKPGPYAM